MTAENWTDWSRSCYRQNQSAGRRRRIGLSQARALARVAGPPALLFPTLSADPKRPSAQRIFRPKSSGFWASTTAQRPPRLLKTFFNRSHFSVSYELLISSDACAAVLKRPTLPLARKRADLENVRPWVLEAA